MEEMPEWVIVQRPGMVPDRKGPIANSKHMEQMLRELYGLYPDCTCTVIEMPHTSYPQSGREWLDMHGDRRRKRPAREANTKPVAFGYFKDGKFLTATAKVAIIEGFPRPVPLYLMHNVK